MEGIVCNIEGGRIVRFERHLKHPIEKVWASITKPEKMKHWLTVDADIELTEGGSLKLRWNNGSGDVVEGKVLKVSPPTELEYTWIEPAAGHSKVSWLLSEEEEGCFLVLTHMFFKTDRVINFLAGWHVHLDVLANVLDGQLQEEYPWHRVKEVQVRYAETLDLP